MSSSKLFRRSWKITVDTLDVSNLAIEFRVLRTIKPEPNKASVTIYNLSDEHRAQLLKRNRPGQSAANLVGVPVRIEAGYQDNTSIIFQGDLRSVSSQLDDVQWKTTVSGDDGGRSWREASISQTFTAGTPYSTVLDQVARALGVGLGNVTSSEAGATVSGIGSSLPHTMTFSGSAVKALERVVKSLGLTWSIQNGVLQILPKGTPLKVQAFRITPTSGLVGSPESAIDATLSLGNPQQFAPGAKQKTAHPPKPKSPGILRLRTLLIPTMRPGAPIILESAAFNGNYFLTEVEYVGQSWSQSWHCNCVARIAA